MTAPTAERSRPLSPPRGRRATTAAAAVAVVAAAALAAQVGAAAPAGAAWSVSGTATSGALTLATWGARFEQPQAGGGTTSLGSSYSASALLAAGPGVLDVVSTSTVPARLTATLTVGSLLPVVVTVQTCPVRWSATATCATTATTVATATIGSLGGTATATWTTDQPSGGRQFARLSTNAALTVAPTVSLQVTAAGTQAPADRTLR